MPKHYRHYRVVDRSKQSAPTSYYDTLCKAAHKQPLVAMGVFLLFFLLLIKCLMGHR